MSARPSFAASALRACCANACVIWSAPASVSHRRRPAANQGSFAWPQVFSDVSDEGEAAALAGFADVIFLGVKPKMLAGVLANLAPHLTPQHTVVSIAAGWTMAQLEAALPDGTRVARVMPCAPPVSPACTNMICTSSGAGIYMQALHYAHHVPLYDALRMPRACLLRVYVASIVCDMSATPDASARTAGTRRFSRATAPRCLRSARTRPTRTGSLCPRCSTAVAWRSRYQRT